MGHSLITETFLPPPSHPALSTPASCTPRAPPSSPSPPSPPFLSTVASLWAQHNLYQAAEIFWLIWTLSGLASRQMCNMVCQGVGKEQWWVDLIIFSLPLYHLGLRNNGLLLIRQIQHLYV